MKQNIKSIRPFIGAKDFELSRKFYADFGFEEIQISAEMSFFKGVGAGFYLQKAYVKDWVDNTMLFAEIQDVKAYREATEKLGLAQKYPGVRLSAVQERDWGREFFVHDPSGILWHFGEFF